MYICKFLSSHMAFELRKKIHRAIQSCAQETYVYGFLCFFFSCLLFFLPHLLSLPLLIFLFFLLFLFFFVF